MLDAFQNFLFAQRDLVFIMLPLLTLDFSSGLDGVESGRHISFALPLQFLAFR
jgi:hypothetical protein